MSSLFRPPSASGLQRDVCDERERDTAGCRRGKWERPDRTLANALLHVPRRPAASGHSQITVAHPSAQNFLEALRPILSVK